MTGVIAVDKPQGWTSFDVCAKLRGIFKTRRVGHSGTLDPMATGVLPVFLGKATGAADLLPNGEKRYEARFKLGYSTDTQDITGETLRTSGKRVTAEMIETALRDFKGEISQLPPMYSAVKVDGKRLYDLAREGKTVERAPRRIEIYSAVLTCFSEGDQSGGLYISCSKGTYIRTVINDLGEKLGTFGVMSELRRTFSQGFDIADCHSIEEIENSDNPWNLTRPVESCFESLPRADLSEKQEKMFKSGVRLDVRRVRLTGDCRDGMCRVFGNGFLGLAEIQEGELRIKKSFWET